MKLNLSTPLTDLGIAGTGGLSPHMAKKLAAAIANYAGKPDPADANVEDLLNYFPIRYEDRSNFIGIDQLYDGIEASVEVYTRVSGGFQVGRNRSAKQPPLFIYEVSGGDRERTRKPVVVFWFVSGKTSKAVIKYYNQRFIRGSRFIAYGKWEWDPRRNSFALKLNKPDELELLPPVDPGFLANTPELDAELDEVQDDGPLEDLGSPEFAMIHTARRVPIYRKLGPFRTKRLREIIFAVLEDLEICDNFEKIPRKTVHRLGLASYADAIREVHFPPDNVPLADYAAFNSPSQRRLIFEEFFWLSFALQLKRGTRKQEPKGTAIELSEGFRKRTKSLLPFHLTDAQERVLREIFADMTSDEPMNRLVQGDVGSGKTIVAFLAMLAAMENGYQAALMAPTEILADQHARNASKFFEAVGYRVALLTGSIKASERRRILKEITSGTVQAVIGTHALIQEGVGFSQLGLAVIDEQHRFGVLQRSALREMGYNPDVLVMTATPIPRSLAMTVYGDLDVSTIDELPPGRTPVKTVVVGEDQRTGVYKGIDREVGLGRQAYVVYPLVEESEKIDLKAATKMYEELRDKIFPNHRVGLIHGRMKPGDKDTVMQEFVAGRLNILVSTTVIEVGVDVPNASLMVIEHAERFGLSQLHQLRGRVGRGAEQSYCVLLTNDKKTAVAKERLGIMEETSDGFRIAERDLEIRGQGEIFGTRQSGSREFRIANLIRDIKILEEAKAEAEHYLVENRLTKTTSKLIDEVISDAKFRLARIG
ncbi:MAG TPA: ATP-dependent DNA helicase RecG [Pyrinomonadaceae bacterium]|nr:ATP-dependent DNA helicase RecG [Pyrinomonadaceae bacterium]